MDFEEIERYILEIPKFSKKTSKENLINIYNQLEIKELPVIHVAGTNGKGSVCSFITSVLGEAGYKAGTFVSPHLIEMTERILIEGRPVSRDRFADAFESVNRAIKKITEDGGQHPSFFEILFLMAMKVFDDTGVDYVVLETGLGGRLDATNIFSKPLISVITSISLDHMEILGDTIEKIAYEKAGIIKNGVPVVYYGQNEAAAQVIEGVIEEKATRGICVKKSDILSMKKSHKDIAFSYKSSYDIHSEAKVPFIADYQCVNGLIAIRTVEALRDTYGLKISDEDMKKGIYNMHWEARMEQVMDNVFIDGAHNEEGVEAFLEVVKNMTTTGRKLMLFSAVVEKQYDEMVRSIATEAGADHIYIARLDSYRALGQEELRKEFEKYISSERLHTYDKVERAVEQILKDKKPEDVVFIVGSLYLAGEVKKYLRWMCNEKGTV